MLEDVPQVCKSSYTVVIIVTIFMFGLGAAVIVSMSWGVGVYDAINGYP
jgi:hypothetical protein